MKTDVLLSVTTSILLVTKPLVNENTGCLTRDVVAVTSGRRRSAGNVTYREKAVKAIVFFWNINTANMAACCSVYRVIHG